MGTVRTAVSTTYWVRAVIEMFGGDEGSDPSDSVAWWLPEVLHHDVLDEYPEEGTGTVAIIFSLRVYRGQDKQMQALRWITNQVAEAGCCANITHLQFTELSQAMATVRTGFRCSRCGPQHRLLVCAQCERCVDHAVDAMLSGR